MANTLMASKLQSSIFPLWDLMVNKSDCEVLGLATQSVLPCDIVPLIVGYAIPAKFALVFETKHTRCVMDFEINQPVADIREAFYRHFPSISRAEGQIQFQGGPWNYQRCNSSWRMGSKYINSRVDVLKSYIYTDAAGQTEHSNNWCLPCESWHCLRCSIVS